MLSFNEALKDKLYRLIGKINDDDSFNCDDHLLQKRRRNSITFLKENGFIQTEAKDLLEKIQRQDAFLKVIYKGIVKFLKTFIYVANNR